MTTLSLSNFPHREQMEIISSAISDDNVSDMLKRIAVMKLQEDTTYRCSNYCNMKNKINLNNKNEDEPVDALCRTKMCQWFYQVTDSCDLSRETVAIAMSYTDRFVCTETGREVLQCRKQYQLATMTAFYMAIKIHEPAVLSLDVLVSLGRGAYTEQDFVEMEMIILSALQWRVNGPTPMSFVRCYLALLPPTVVNSQLCKQILSSVRYQTEIAVAESSFIDYLPSEIALAAIANSLSEVDTKIVPSNVQQELYLEIATYADLCSNDVIDELQANLTLLLIGVSPTMAVVNCPRKQTHTTKSQSGSKQSTPVTSSSAIGNSSLQRHKSPVRISITEII